MTHIGCWMTYYLYKARTECPICHRIYNIQPPPPSVITTRFDISNPQPIRVIIVPEEVNDTRYRNIVKNISLTILFSFILFMIIMHFA
jgi:predicted transposase YdaD